MKKTILPIVTICFVFVLTSCGGSDSKNDSKEKDKYEQTRETLEQTEKKNPKRFLSVTGSDKKNLLRQTVIKGTISSKATVASYKDVDVELSFFSKTGALLEKDHEVIYETVAPGSSVSFKSKYYAPKGTDSISLKIIGAKTE